MASTVPAIAAGIRNAKRFISIEKDSSHGVADRYEEQRENRSRKHRPTAYPHGVVLFGGLSDPFHGFC